MPIVGVAAFDNHGNSAFTVAYGEVRIDNVARQVPKRTPSREESMLNRRKITPRSPRD